MNNTSIRLLIASCLVAPLLAQITPSVLPDNLKIAPIAPGTVVEKKMSLPQAQPSDATGGGATSSEMIYKTSDSRISIRQWPSGRTTYDVTVGEWQFLTDPAAPEKYKDYVQTIPMIADRVLVPDFPEIRFSSERAKIEATNIEGRSTWLVTGPELKPQYTDEFIADIKAKTASASDQAEILKNLREAQRAESARGPLKPDQVWVDAKSLLPVKANIGGTQLSYTYKRGSPPALPAFLRDEIAKKIAP